MSLLLDETVNFSICFSFSFKFFLHVMHIISAADFPVFCSNSARKCLIMPAEYSPQKSLIIPNRTFLVRFGGISGEFGERAMGILARLRLAKIPMAKPNEPEMLPKRIKKGAIRYLPYPNSS